MAEQPQVPAERTTPSAFDNEPAASAPRRPRRGRWIVLGVVLLLVTVGIVAWRLHARSAAAAAAPAGKPVKVERAAIERTVESSGTVSANLEVEIKCRASGEVVELPYDISDKVKQGDLLCQLDPSDQELSVRSAQANVAQDEAKLAQAKAALEEATLALATSRDLADAALTSAKIRAENARSKVDRQRQLNAAKLGSPEELETMQTDTAAAVADLTTAQVGVEQLKQQQVALESKRQDVKLAEAALESGRIALSTAQRNLGYTTVTAPTDGVVASLSVQKGSIVASGINNVSGGTTIMTLLDLSRIFVLATVDESDIGGVQVGQEARVNVDSYPGRAFAGRVVRVAVQGVNASNIVTFEVKVEVLDERKDLLKPQMTGNVTIVEASRPDALTVPVAAVSRQGPRSFVTTADGARREVKLGLEGVERTEIADGLNEGDAVLVKSDEPESRWRNGGGGGPP